MPLVEVVAVLAVLAVVAVVAVAAAVSNLLTSRFICIFWNSKLQYNSAGCLGMLFKLLHLEKTVI